MFQERFQERANTGFNRTFAVEVTLAHGEWITEPFQARWSDQKYELADADGHYTVLHLRDFEFDVASASWNEAEFEPRRGDIITMSQNGVDVKFELLPPGNLPVCELQPGGYRWKVHTKQVG